MAEPLARDLDLDGLRLRLWDHGSEGGPVVLFVHGYLDTGRSFDAVVEALGGRFRGLALDWRGHGESQWAPPGASYHLLDHLKDLTRVLALLEREGTPIELLVAHSMGGNIGLMMAGSWPEKVPRLLLLDAFGPPSEGPQMQPGRMGRVLRGMMEVRPFRVFSSLEEVAARIKISNPGLSVRGARRMARHVAAPDGEGRWVFKLDPRLRGPTPVRWPEETWLTFCRGVAGPVRLLRAERGYVPLGATLDGRLAACGGSMRTVKGAMHHLHVEHPGAVAAEVAGMLNQS